jgi:cytochrome o ubiquinol oxidase subunit 2
LDVAPIRRIFTYFHAPDRRLRGEGCLMGMELPHSTGRAPAPGTLWRRARRMTPAAVLLGVMPLLGGCDIDLMDPKGPIGLQEKSLIILATVLMLVVVVPVILMVLGFAWRYRASNTSATFAPDWEHSTKIELVVWLVPCVIIAILGSVTWVTTHTLDPYRSISGNSKPVEVEVVSLDWKWLFIYPELKVASVNELALPVGTPVHFRLTSATVMNSFFIPRLGTQVYTMTGMQTQLSLEASEPGNYYGISANYSGDGFSDMHFIARAMTQGDFDQWVEKARHAGPKLTMATYQQLAQPSERVPVGYYGDVDASVFHGILNKCANGATCTDDAMRLSMTQKAFGDVALCTQTKPQG